LSVGPGKIHVNGWPQVVEQKGLVRTPENELVREVYLNRPETSIKYIGAILDVIAMEAASQGWNLRNNPEILGQVYHSFTYAQWKSQIAAKPRNAPFSLVPGTMGPWILDNEAYLEGAVGKPELQ
jgi:hypothetical protein